MSNEKGNLQIAVHQIPKVGNHLSGDSYFYTKTDDVFICAVADGLGSGERAKESSDIVIETVENNIHASVEQLVKACNEKLWKKRGAVLGILKLFLVAKTYSFSSIGNIGMMRVFRDGKKKRNIPNTGYLSGYRRPMEVEHDKLEAGTNFYLFSDGVKASDLSHRLFLDRDVQDAVDQYAELYGYNRHDDTTLIGICYDGKTG